MGTGSDVTALTDRITAAKMNAKLETVSTGDCDAGAITGADIADEGILAGKLQTTTLDATNALKVTTGALSGGLGVTSGQLHIVLEASEPSLQISSNELGLKIPAAGGLAKGAGGVGINIKANSGLAADADGLQTVIEANKGIGCGLNGLNVDFDNSTIGIVTNKLAVKDAGITNAKLANAYSFMLVPVYRSSVGISQSDIELLQFTAPAALTLVAVQVYCTDINATASVDVKEDGVSVLSAAITPTADGVATGTVSDAAIAEGAAVTVHTTTNGSGTITDLQVTLIFKVALTAIA